MLKLRGMRGGVGGGALSATRPGVRPKDAGPWNSREPVSNPAPSSYRSKWEETYAALLAMEQRAGIIHAWAYESMTLKLSKGKYHRIDFLIWHNDFSIELAQVKGYHKNIRDSMTHLKWAAQLNPWFRFTLKRRVGRDWESTTVEV